MTNSCRLFLGLTWHCLIIKPKKSKKSPTKNCPKSSNLKLYVTGNLGECGAILIGQSAHYWDNCSNHFRTIVISREKYPRKKNKLNYKQPKWINYILSNKELCLGYCGQRPCPLLQLIAVWILLATHFLHCIAKKAKVVENLARAGPLQKQSSNRPLTSG